MLPEPDCALTLTDPSPSHDGSRVVVATDRDGLAIVGRADGQLTPLGIKGPLAEWSPDGSMIAYAGAGIHVMNADGSGRRLIAPVDVQGRPSWSPDGAWLVYRVAGRLELVRVASGERLPLGYSGGLIEPAWHPDS
jgi:Tol biopolymer transport system component